MEPETWRLAITGIARSGLPSQAEERMRHPCADLMMARVSNMITQQGQVVRCSPSFDRIAHLQRLWCTNENNARFHRALGRFCLTGAGSPYSRVRLNAT